MFVSWGWESWFVGCMEHGPRINTAQAEVVPLGESIFEDDAGLRSSATALDVARVSMPGNIHCLSQWTSTGSLRLRPSRTPLARYDSASTAEGPIMGG